MATEISKVVGYAVLRPPPDAISLTKVVGYAVLRPESEVTPEPPSTPRVIAPVWIGL